MKFKIVILSLICLIIGSTNASASSFSDFYPGGKNYLEYDNFTVSTENISTIDNIRVKSDTTYTLSIPGDGSIENPYFRVESYDNVYIDDYATDVSICDYGMNYTVCTFTTSIEDEYIRISIDGMFIGGMFSYYNGQDFQLEEGAERTDYEVYIIPLLDSNNPEFSGNAAFVIAYHDNYDIEDIIRDHIVVIDDIDGDISENIVIVSDAYTSNKHVVGEYLVELTATDQSGNSAFFNLTIVVKDEEVPSIVGPSELNVNVEDNDTIEEIVSSNYLGSDGYEGTTSISISNDNYSINSHVLGNYNVTLNTEDTSGNQATKDIVITVVDIESPTLNSSNTINVYMSGPNTLPEILEALDISDNYDSNQSITTTILQDDFTISEHLIGTYNVDLVLKDSSDNANTVTLYLNVIDDVAPIISGPSSYSVSYVDALTLDEVINLFTISDNYDELTTSVLQVTSNTYTSRNTDTGVFTIEFEVVDSSSNVTTHLLEISVVDDQAPIIYIDDYLVTLSDNVSFSPEDALSILINNHELPNKFYHIEVLNDEYSGNEETPGTYLYSLLFTDDEGNDLQKDFVVKVQKEESILNKGLIVRNVIVYGVSITFFGFVVYKNKK